MLLRRPLFLLVAGIALVLGSSALTYVVAYRSAQADLQAIGRHRLDLYAASLEREIAKYAFLPGTLNLSDDVVRLVSETTAQQAPVNRYLAQLNERAGTLAIYVMDVEGHVRAASNWQRADSYVGEHLAFRPYFVEAKASNEGRFFGIGTTRGEPGYYLASALYRNRQMVGVAAVKVSLEQLEKSWANVETPVLVSDANGVVLLSTVADWKFAALRPLDAQAQAQFERTQQFNHRALKPLNLAELPGHYVAQARPMPGTDWTFTVLSRLDTVERLALNEAVIGGLAMATLLLLAQIFNERRRRTNERLMAREALQRAHDELERKVTERTADLTQTNQQLRAKQEELVQAGKLAVIGQLSTGIAHELNQPLAALRTLSANAVRFLERGDIATVQGNLSRMAGLVDRMGAITGQLRNFARKSNRQLQAVDLSLAVGNACALLAPELEKARVQLKLSPELPSAQVWCDSNRLEQVLVNLLSNASDALQAQAVREISVHWRCVADRVQISVQDTGPGLSDAVLQHLFEPFFTTKSGDRGLGLGLVISAEIVRDFGGTLQGHNHPLGGAEFTLELPLYIRHD